MRSLYATGPTPELFWGLTFAESSRRQFEPRAIPDMSPDTLLWPLESRDDRPRLRGSHIGLMQVATTLRRAFDWRENVRFGIEHFLTEKLPAAIRNEDRSQREYEGLPDMTPFQREQQAVMLYGSQTTAKRDDQYWVPGCDGDLRGRKNCRNGTWKWVVNTMAGDKADGKGFEYVERVYGHLD